MKFKVGDVVRVTRNLYTRSTDNIGSIGKVEMVYGSLPYPIYIKISRYRFSLPFREDELEFYTGKIPSSHKPIKNWSLT